MPDIMQSVRLRQPELSSINTFPPPPLVPPIYTEAGTMLPEYCYAMYHCTYYVPAVCLHTYLVGRKMQNMPSSTKQMCGIMSI